MFLFERMHYKYGYEAKISRPLLYNNFQIYIKIFNCLVIDCLEIACFKFPRLWTHVMQKYSISS